MEIDIQLVPSPPNSNILLNRTVVVIDVLRATSVMVHAMSQGASEIIPVATVEEAFQMRKVLPRPKAFHLVSQGREILVGSFFNIEALAQRCLELNRDLLIFPSGDEGNFSLEDNLCGGMLIERIMKISRRRIALTDASHCARILYERYKANIVEAFRLSHHGKELIKRGFGEDLVYCAQMNITNIVPEFKDGGIRTD